MHQVNDPTPDRPYVSAIRKPESSRLWTIQKPNTRLLGQESLEKVLRKLLGDLNCHVEFGVELVDLSQDGECVHAVLRHTSGEIEETNYKYLIGADGAKSTVRKKLGFNFLGENTEAKMVVAEFMLEGLDNDVSNHILVISSPETCELGMAYVGNSQRPSVRTLPSQRAVVLNFVGSPSDRQNSLVFLLS